MLHVFCYLSLGLHVFDAIVNSIVFLIASSNSLLILYGNTI